MDVCDPTVKLVSSLAAGISFAVWLVAQLPQVVEIYQNKSVDGISPLFILIWLFGDLTSFIGCIFTEQLFFQYAISSYFLFNDVIIIGQFYYYGVYLKEKPTGHGGNTLYGSVSQHIKSLLPITLLASNVGSSEAFMFLQGSNSSTKTIGIICAWISACLYFFARIPQLYKNYQRKSTEDLSPYLFCCTLIANSTYAISILVSCEFLYDEAKWDFFLNELPYIIGSAGTMIFDVAYFYQVYIYSRDTKSDEEAPLLSSG